MAVIKTETQVIGYLFDAQVWLEGQETTLSYDGDHTWKSTDLVNVEGDLNITFHGVGIADAQWEFTITQLRPEDERKELYKKDGSIRSTGHSIIIDSTPLSQEG